VKIYTIKVYIRPFGKGNSTTGIFSTYAAPIVFGVQKHALWWHVFKDQTAHYRIWQELKLLFS
jgi:hypothetical protein